MIGACPSPGGGEEYAFTFDRARTHRLLVVPALFDEANKLRRFTVEVMRGLDEAGIDCLVPDLPGCNESLAPLNEQTVACWREAANLAANHFRATSQLTIRGGALVAADLPGWSYAPVEGAALLSGLLRARIIASREAGAHETRDGLLAEGTVHGLTVAGYSLGAAMIAELGRARPGERLEPIPQSELGAGGLWLRAEPGEDAAQARTLAGIVSGRIHA